MHYILNTSRNGTPLISFTPSYEPIPKPTDKETVSFPTMFIEELCFKRFFASSFSTKRSQ